VEVGPLGSKSPLTTKERTIVLKTDDFELVRLAIPGNETVSESTATGETVFHCLEGKARFTAYGKSQTLGSGSLLYLPRGELFTVETIDDSWLLLTILSPKS